MSLTVRGLMPSPTLAINEHSERLRQQGRTIYKLGLGQSPFPVPEAVVEALRANSHQKDYLPVMGLGKLREAVAQYQHRTRGLASDPEDVLIGPGSKELMFLLQLVYYGELVVPTPGWVSYAPQAQIVGRPVHWLPARARDDWKLIPEDLEELCRRDPDHPRVLILNYPSNPTGVSYSTEELEALAQVTRRYRMIVLSDEIYGELDHRGRHVSVARYYPEGTIVSGGLSKWCGAGGWRLGTFTFPPALRWLRDAMAAVASETYSAVSAPIQFAAVRAFEGSPEIDRYLRQSRQLLAALAGHVTERLRAFRLELVPPCGGFYLFPDFEPWRQTLGKLGLTTSEELCERLLQQTGVATLPGSAFGRPADELTVRLAYVDFDGKSALEAMPSRSDQTTVGKELLQQHCARVLDAVEAIGAWLQDRATA